MIREVAVMGAGSWGTTYAALLAGGGCRVRLWGRRAELVEAMRRDGVNADYMPDLALPEGVTPYADPAQAMRGADMVVIAVPSQHVRSTLEVWGGAIPPDAVVVSLVKGVERGSGRRMSELIGEIATVSPSRLAVVSGPNIAVEIARRTPCATVVASVDEPCAHEVAQACRTPFFHPVVSTDVVGVELGGAVKNVIAIAVGMAEGLGYGDNTKSTIITRGLAETVRLGMALGARRSTFLGLAGAGDLIATCMSPLSRNHSVGAALGRGRTVEELVAATRQTAEGLASCEAILTVARRHGVEMPLVEAVVAVVHDGHAPALIGNMLMARMRKAEWSEPI